jgi:predicted dehydrogenase
VCVFDELSAAHIADPAGIAPAYDGEDTVDFLSHPWMREAPVFPSLEAMLDEAPPDVLVVSTRPDRIATCALAGLAAGCHLIIEKPLALDLDSLQLVHAATRKAQRRVMAMLSMRSLPAFAAAREAVRSGRIGKPVLVNTRKSYKWGQRAAWFNDRSKYGGTWPWIGIHNLDMAHFVTGLHAVRVVAMHANAAHPDFPECEDAGTAVFSLEDGVQMTASVDLCRPGNAATWGDDWIRVVGSTGVIEANGSTGHVTILAESGETIQTGTTPVPIYLDFLRSLRDPSSDSDAFQLTAAALAARESADSGAPVSINPAIWNNP